MRIFIVAIILTTFSVSAQTKMKLQTIYYPGLWVNSDSCFVELNRKYGFKAIESGSCMSLIDQLELHNKKVEKRLDKRNVIDWRKRYDAELKICNEKIIKTK